MKPDARKKLPPAAPARDLTASERVAALLRADIIRGEIRAGARLKVRELAERYGTSIMPVREALRLLDGERLVELEAHRGGTVRQVTVSFIREIYDVRGVLEALLAEGCARSATRAERQEILALARSWEDLAGSGASPKVLLAANSEFHGRIAAAGRNQEAEAILSRGWPLQQGLRQQLGYGPARVAAIAAQHMAIAKAIHDGDADLAAKATREHTDAAREDLVGQLNQMLTVEIPTQRTARK